MHLALLAIGPGPAHFVLSLDETELSSGTVETGRGYDGAHAMGAGAVVSIAIDCGLDGSFAGDSTGVHLNVCTVP